MAMEDESIVLKESKGLFDDIQLENVEIIEGKLSDKVNTLVTTKKHGLLKQYLNSRIEYYTHTFTFDGLNNNILNRTYEIFDINNIPIELSTFCLHNYESLDNTYCFFICSTNEDRISPLVSNMIFYLKHNYICLLFFKKNEDVNRFIIDIREALSLKIFDMKDKDTLDDDISININNILIVQYTLEANILPNAGVARVSTILFIREYSDNINVIISDDRRNIMYYGETETILENIHNYIFKKINDKYDFIFPNSQRGCKAPVMSNNKTATKTLSSIKKNIEDNNDDKLLINNRKDLSKIGQVYYTNTNRLKKLSDKLLIFMSASIFEDYILLDAEFNLKISIIPYLCRHLPGSKSLSVARTLLTHDLAKKKIFNNTIDSLILRNIILYFIFTFIEYKMTGEGFEIHLALVYNFITNYFTFDKENIVIKDIYNHVNELNTFKNKFNALNNHPRLCFTTNMKKNESIQVFGSDSEIDAIWEIGQFESIDIIKNASLFSIINPIIETTTTDCKNIITYLNRVNDIIQKNDEDTLKNNIDKIDSINSNLRYYINIIEDNISNINTSLVVKIYMENMENMVKLENNKTILDNTYRELKDLKKLFNSLLANIYHKPKRKRRNKYLKYKIKYLRLKQLLSTHY